mmetsp:Transcript_7463/g.8465  ORF Transcript_7463/g.8465 Transcript_7463/m.8465 type:complete len:399 (+) Transcript_7463:26-1222(+)
MEKYKTIGELGVGTFGKVTKAVHKETGEIVAIKAMKQKFYTWEECMNLREVKSLRKLNNHDNIVKLNEVFRKTNDLFFVFEYVEKDLFKVMQDNNNQMDIKEIKSIMFQLLDGLSYTHKNNFFHRDLKPENILMTDGKVKLADFGLAREIRSKPPYTDYVSTRWYRAPELLLKSTNYNSPVDIFAAGCILAELISGRPLFPGSSEGDQLMKVCSTLGTPSNIDWPEGHKLASKLGYKFPKMVKTPLEDLIPDASREAIDLIEKMFEYDPNNRLTAKECLEHEFFDGFEVPKFNKSFSKVSKSAMHNKNNKLLSSKFMRRSSKNFDLERKKSPIPTKNDISKPSVARHIFKPQISNINMHPHARKPGFYSKNKPVKSPGTPASSDTSKGFLGGKNYGHK